MLEEFSAFGVALSDEDEIDGVVVDDFGDVAVYLLHLLVVLSH